MNIEQRARVPGPAVLARKILCTAYIPAPLLESDRLRLQGMHAMTLLKVVGRHLKAGYILKQVECFLGKARIDLLFQDPMGKVRLAEVKASNKIREVHKIQAALYAAPNIDQIVVSTNNEDQVLTPQFIEEIRKRSEDTIQFLSSDPAEAARTYTPHEDSCYICANSSCPFLSKTIYGKAA